MLFGDNSCDAVSGMSVEDRRSTIHVVGWRQILRPARAHQGIQLSLPNPDKYNMIWLHRTTHKGETYDFMSSTGCSYVFNRGIKWWASMSKRRRDATQISSREERSRSTPVRTLVSHVLVVSIQHLVISHFPKLYQLHPATNSSPVFSGSQLSYAAWQGWVISPRRKSRLPHPCIPTDVIQ